MNEISQDSTTVHLISILRYYSHDVNSFGTKLIRFLFSFCIVVNPYHASQDQTHPAGAPHQQLSQQPQQNSGFARTGQAFYNSRGVSRGGPRNARGGMNGYRGPANGFRGKV